MLQTYNNWFKKLVVLSISKSKVVTKNAFLKKKMTRQCLVRACFEMKKKKEKVPHLITSVQTVALSNIFTVEFELKTEHQTIYESTYSN